LFRGDPVYPSLTTIIFLPIYRMLPIASAARVFAVLLPLFFFEDVEGYAGGIRVINILGVENVMRLVTRNPINTYLRMTRGVPCSLLSALCSLLYFRNLLTSSYQFNTLLVVFLGLFIAQAF
jgi:hypothetical protein